MNAKEKTNARKESEAQSKKLSDEELSHVAGGSPYGMGEEGEEYEENIDWEQLIEG